MASDWRQGRLVSSEYDETTWAARSFMAFVTQRISVAIHISLAQEIAEALPWARRRGHLRAGAAQPAAPADPSRLERRGGSVGGTHQLLVQGTTPP